MSVRHVQMALREARAASDYYLKVDRDLAVRFLDELDRAVVRIVANPEAWEHLGRGLRRCKVSGFPYNLIYRVEADEIVIYAVAHQRRKPGYWRRRVPR